MPTHALLGATGSTGSAVLQFLLDEPIKDLELRICVRNKSKLLKSFPDLESTTAFTCQIIEGNLDNTSDLKSCLRRADIIYNCIASNDSAKGISVAQDAAKAILSALKALKLEQKSSYTRPALLINRSMTLNEDHPTFSFSHYLVTFALYYCYDDIAKACGLFRSAAINDRLLDFICVDPPALHASSKTKGTGYKLQMTGEPFRSLNYADLGAAFVRSANEHKNSMARL